MSHLKNCPCCNGEAEHIAEENIVWLHRIQCKVCGLSTGSYVNNPEFAVSVWNKREYVPVIEIVEEKKEFCSCGIEIKRGRLGHACPCGKKYCWDFGNTYREISDKLFFELGGEKLL